MLAGSSGAQAGRRTGIGIELAADFVVGQRPGDAPGALGEPGWRSQPTIASEIAGLVRAADIARDNGDQTSAGRYLRTADNWQKERREMDPLLRTARWLSTSYYLEDHQGWSSRTLGLPTSSATAAHLPWISAPWWTPATWSSCASVSNRRTTRTSCSRSMSLTMSEGLLPNGTFWHRYNFDGYGEQPDGSPWDIGFPRAASAPAPNPRPTIGLASGRSSPRRARRVRAGRGWPAAGRLESMAEAGSPGARCSPSRRGTSTSLRGRGFPPGRVPSSATPLRPGTHAQYVRPCRVHRRGTPNRTAPDRGRSLRRQRLLPERKSGRRVIRASRQAGLLTALLG